MPTSAEKRQARNARLREQRKKDKESFVYLKSLYANVQKKRLSLLTRLNKLKSSAKNEPKKAELRMRIKKLLQLERHILKDAIAKNSRSMKSF